MRDFLTSVFYLLLIIGLITCMVGLGFQIYNEHTTDKQHIKVQRVGCHQYRVNQYTDEVTHLEGCNSAEHLNEAE
jgi:hypothetical protein